MQFARKLLILSFIKGVGIKTLNTVLKSDLLSMKSDFDIYEYYNILRESNRRLKPISEEDFNDCIRKADEILEKNEAYNIKTICKYSSDYPQSFTKIPVPPAILYVRGNIESLSMNGIAVIGTRNISPYGQKVGERFGEVVSDKGLTVISGLAEGCDSAGHLGCLNAKGITIAIMPTPLDTVYPKKNTKLAERILENNGCLISEYALGSFVTKASFVERDRLQCGLADGVIVVETGVKSGTMHAVNGSLLLKKPIGCFNYNNEHYQRYESSVGNRVLIESQKAISLYDSKSIDDFIDKCLNNNDADNTIQDNVMYEASLFA